MRPSLLTKVRVPSIISKFPPRPAQKLVLAATGASRRTTAFTNQQPRPLTIRHLTTTTIRTAKMSSNPQPRFSDGSDTTDLETSLAPLLTTNGGRWTLTADGEGLEREFKFKTFAKTWDFMTAVALQCKLKSHHPEWSNVFNTTFIRWTTHHPKGLSAQDVELAGICDGLARDFGEVVVEQQPPAAQAQQEGGEQQGGGKQQKEEGKACGLSGLADRAVGSAGDCCVPKSK